MPGNLAKMLIVIAGPTAVGKTAVAIHISRILDAQIVSADSRQIFRELNIGTAKPTAEELRLIPHYFINSHSIHDDFDAAQYGDEALDLINRLFVHDDYVVLCGGSGLYIKGVCEGFDEIPDIPREIRESLLEAWRAHGLSWLQRQMRELDPGHYENIDQMNPHRLIRALEVRISTGMSIASFRTKSKRTHDFDIVKIGLELPREELYARIDRRMDDMIAAGLFEEARELYPLRHLNALQTVGYREIFGHIEGHYDREEAIRLLKRNSRRYAKRQLTWFKRDPSFSWFLPGQLDEILALIRRRGIEKM